MERDIKEEILGASFYENWQFAKELHRMGHPKAIAQSKAAKEIQEDWFAHKRQVKEDKNIAR